MSLGNWIKNTHLRIHRDGVGGIIESGHSLYRGSWRIVGTKLPIGTNVFEREWDVLILFDGCRVDALEEVIPKHELQSFDFITSVGSSSREWMAKTFHPSHIREVAETVYVTANPYTDDILSPGKADGNRSPFNPKNWMTLNSSDFAHVEEVWKHSWVRGLGTVPPRKVTDRAISLSREHEPKRLIIHYMQPHQPFIPIIEQSNSRNGEGETEWVRKNCWQALYRGEVSHDAVWNAYLLNLKLVLDEVPTLLQNIDGETTVISADHGNAFGEWGIFGHPAGFLHPAVKRVPWATTSAVDTGAYEPSEQITVSDEISVMDRLEQLGYL